jgi:hypothetical protein
MGWEGGGNGKNGAFCRVKPLSQETLAYAKGMAVGFWCPFNLQGFEEEQ